MEHDNNRSNNLDAGSKPRWRTPTLTLEKVAEVTNGDTTPLGSDSQTTTYGVPLGFTS